MTGRISTLILAVFFTVVTHAQQVLMQQSYDKGELHSAWGPNERNYIHISFGYGLAFGPHGAGFNVNNRGSNSVPLLIRYKYKLSGLLAISAETGIRVSKFALAPQATASFPDSLFKGLAVVHKDAEFAFDEIPLAIFIRFNFDPGRGNTIGKYLDLGGQVLYNIGARYTVTDKLTNGETRQTEYSGLSYANDFREEVYARVGTTFFALIFRYNLTDYFKSSYNFPKFPPFSAGIELNFAK